MIDSFKTVSEYCTRSGKDIQVRNHAYCLFVTAFQRALEEHRKANNGAEAKPKEITDKKAALLTPDSIEGYISRAEALVDAASEDIRKTYEKAYKKQQFLSSVFASVLAAFIYSIIIVVVYWIGRDQINTWLHQLTQK